MNKKSLALCPTIIYLFLKRPLVLSLGDEPAIDKMAGCNPEDAALEGGRVSLSAGRNAETRPLPCSLLASPYICQAWKSGEAPQQWRCATIKVLHENNDRLDSNSYRGISLVDH